MNPDALLPMAYSIKVSKHLENLKQEYEKKNGKLSESHVKQKHPFCFERVKGTHF